MDSRNIEPMSNGHFDAPNHQANHQGGPTMRIAAHKPRAPKFIWAIVACIVIILVAVGCWMMFTKFNPNSDIKSSQYQAIFLANGQVYFGKLTDVNRSYVKLSNVYYLQVKQDVQSAEAKDDNNVSIAKLGNELHGPEDMMNISRDQVLFWENLKDDSKVVQAIKNYQK